MAKLSSYLRGSTTATGINTSSNLVIGSNTSTGTADQNFQVTGGSYISGNTGIGSAIPQAKLDVEGGARIVGVVTATGGIDASLLLGTPQLAGISSTISGTAVDVFVYDTSKDSDGGAWRKRTQHTSWYNETLNTATRGSRREFPAVAVIVVEQYKVTIYDGDDPDLPMWMVFLSGGSYNWSGTVNDLTSIYMLNGILVCGYGGSGGGAREITFTSDIIRVLYTADYKPNGGIKTRNDSVSWGSGETRLIVNANVNDVAMTVLPNAPIDPSTGLPIPTIAVATNGGLSIIKDDGTVISGGEDNASWQVNKLFIDSNYNIWGSEGSDYSPGIQLLSTLPYSSVADIGTGTLGYQLTTQVTTAYGRNTSWPFILGTYGSYESRHVAGKEYIFNGARYGLTFLQDNTTNRSSSMVAYATTSYNTGWMHGNIKGAWLSDTSTTSVTGTELITNGTFDSNTTGWTANTSTNTWSSGTMQITRSGGSGNTTYQSFTTVAGQRYVASAQVNSSGSRGDMYIMNGTGWAGTVLGGALGTSGQTRILTVSFIATSTTTTLGFSIDNNSTSIFVDNVSVRIADPDRSVNNKGLAVYGTITKSAVATGAELVAYSGFSASNHLAQPYNSDLNPGSGSYSVVAWFKTESNNSGSGVITGLGNGDLDEVMLVYVSSTYGIYFDYGSGSEYVYLSSSDDRSMVRDGNWHQVVCQVTAGQIGEIYIDGIKKSTAQNVAAPSTWSQWDTNYQLYIGCGRGLGTLPFSGSISLVRYSLSKMSTEQIKKIYEDEKVLFQENAACTLHGSSDAVTALAYDDSTNLLYAGTSSGRSDFQGLRRINNTTTAVTTTISASNGLVAEQ